jgi:hypothetical protein
MKEKILFRAPRIITILAILFMMVFSLDAFEGDDPIGRKMLGLLMNSIPALLLVVVLIISWKWEVAGGILFIAAFVAMSILFKSFNGNTVSLIVIGPFLLVGILFILHHILYGRNQGK